jgi:potassium-dependent mechanosensitive channel
MSPATIVETILAIVIGLVVLAAAIWSLRKVAALLPMGRRRRARLVRLLPLLEVALAVATILAIAAFILAAQPTALTAVVVALAAVLLGASWFAVRDSVTGAVLRAEDAYQVGQWLRVDAVDGRVRTVGARTIELEREDGTRVRIPYTRLAAALLIRAGGTEDPSGHTFTVDLPPALAPVRILPVIRSAARNCFFVSATRDPEVHVSSSADGHRYDVTVFTLDRTFLPEIESAVRERIAEEGPT